MNVCEFCGREIPRGRLCTKHLAMRVLLPIRYWQMVAKSANEAAIREQMDLEYEQRRSAEASKALTAERAEAAEAKENMESAMRALEQVRAELEQVRAELKEEHIRRLEEQMQGYGRCSSRSTGRTSVSSMSSAWAKSISAMSSSTA